MKKIYKLVIQTYLGPLLLTFFISLFILLMQFLFLYIDDLVGKGLEWYIIAELLFYASSTFVPLALPLAIMLSSIMTFGNLGEHYELVAMKSAGISLRKIMLPLVVLSIIISAFAFYFSNSILPIANLKFKTLLYDVRKKKMAINIKEGVFFDDMADVAIRVGRKHDDGNTLYNVMIYDHTRRRGNIDVTVADSGRMAASPDGQIMIFTLYDGYSYQDNVDQRNYRKTRPFQRTFFRERITVFDLSEFALTRTQEELFKTNYQMLNIGQLNYAIDSLATQLEEKKSAFAVNILRNFRFHQLMDSVAFHPDSIHLEQNILENFDHSEQVIVVANALTASRNLKKAMQYHKDDYVSKDEHIIKHKVIWHKKFTLSFACLVIFFIGAPMGAIIRKGGLGLPVVISVLLFVVFHIISMIGEKSARQGAIETQYGMWLASAVFLPFGVYLTYKATADAPLMDREIWSRIFARFDLVGWFKKRKKKKEESSQLNKESD